MSIVPAHDGSGSGSVDSPSGLYLENFFNESFRDPFTYFFRDSIFTRGIFPSREMRVNWKETATSHVLTADFADHNANDILVYIDDDNMLQISTENGEFESKFKVPDNAIREHVNASMVNGVLTVSIPKVECRRPGIREIEISGC